MPTSRTIRAAHLTSVVHAEASAPKPQKAPHLISGTLHGNVTTVSNPSNSQPGYRDIRRERPDQARGGHLFRDRRFHQHANQRFDGPGYLLQRVHGPLSGWQQRRGDQLCRPRPLPGPQHRALLGDLHRRGDWHYRLADRARLFLQGDPDRAARPRAPWRSSLLSKVEISSHDRGTGVAVVPRSRRRFSAWAPDRRPFRAAKGAGRVEFTWAESAGRRAPFRAPFRSS